MPAKEDGWQSGGPSTKTNQQASSLLQLDVFSSFSLTFVRSFIDTHISYSNRSPPSPELPAT
ncbi:uncharacterized protein ARB_03695 [Trichophyton benhamiae CBS 112371]|uniref:Uncharacterized protein n=1 Tax=Arthroderma benhamiae (strain ATCC MYA-4681 / CBS 112371) TaxID=663331 RepID=D4B5F5_ARTBC|nr:uncharacterized protein ARB_03695 [Trichophyton benhamiae CBS 112371]EFE29441.1 hypothetical protein ARB_03695 [Trichophyton benhamiae CBS 112371]